MGDSIVRMWDDPVTYTVKGHGPFPFDMLRRDMAWPSTSEDAMKLGETKSRSVTLTAHKARYVSVPRWESFGWKVEKGEHFPYYQYDPERWDAMMKEVENVVAH